MLFFCILKIITLLKFLFPNNLLFIFLLLVCDKVLQTDILFLLDTSGSVGLENFDKMKDFVKSIIMKFDVDNQMSRVGILTFDSDAEILIKLSDHNSLKNLLSEVDSIRYSEGTETRIDKALSKAMEAFSEQNGGRADANKVDDIVNCSWVIM